MIALIIVLYLSSDSGDQFLTLVPNNSLNTLII